MLIIFLWAIIGVATCLSYFDTLMQVDDWAQFIATAIFFIGGPFFLIVEILEFILDLILPEGWEDNDNSSLGEL